MSTAAMSPPPTPSGPVGVLAAVADLQAAAGRLRAALAADPAMATLSDDAAAAAAVALAQVADTVQAGALAGLGRVADSGYPASQG